MTLCKLCEGIQICNTHIPFLLPYTLSIQECGNIRTSSAIIPDPTDPPNQKCTVAFVVFSTFPIVPKYVYCARECIWVLMVGSPAQLTQYNRINRRSQSTLFPVYPPPFFPTASTTAIMTSRGSWSRSSATTFNNYSTIPIALQCATYVARMQHLYQHSHTCLVCVYLCSPIPLKTVSVRI